MTTTPDAREIAVAAFDRVLAAIEGARSITSVPPAARAAARLTALSLLDGGEAGTGAELAVLVYAAELLSAIAVDLASDPVHTERLIERLQAEAGVPRVALAREMLRSGRLPELGVEIAIEVHLALLVSFTGAGGISLWTLAEEEPRPLAHAGRVDPGARAARDAARALLAGDGAQPAADTDMAGLRIAPLRAAAAAVLAHDVDPVAGRHGPVLAAAAPGLAALLERNALIGREQSRESVGGAVERRLARLRFDLHDGPQQDVHLLAADLRLFRDQLRPMIAGDPDEERVLGRIDDLEAQLVALDGDLRRLSSSVQSPFFAPGSLEEALAQVTDAFAQRTGIMPQARCTGDLSRLSDSQQIALLALIREALSNVRKHSDATSVTITVAAERTGVVAEITDDGTGFEPETTLVRAARAGHLGLVGMHERVRMLGGRTQIESRPGGPTIIRATLPAWSRSDAD